MKNRHWLKLILAGWVWAAFFAAPGLPLPAVDRLGLAGTAAAQESIDIDTFYNELAPYGQWVWHPRFGYVWLPETVSDNWRPYTVGRWTYTDEYGWYWDSYEPFAWAVYHYGRWGYDPDYGWFWVPGDTWAPAWVQWRYSDDYVGWAPIGPGPSGYAYGVPVNYDPPIAESWVFVQPRYMTSRAIAHYAVPIGGLSVAFFGATNVYRPIYRGGVVYNYGMPRDRVVKIIKRPIFVQKVYKVDNWKGGRFDNNGPNRGIKVYQPRFSKDNNPNRGPKKFVDNPNDFKPKAKLRETYKGDLPKGWGPSAKGVTPIAKEAGPDAFKTHGRFGGPDNEQADRNDKDRDNDKGKGEASKGGPGGPNQFKEGNRDQGNRGGGQDKSKGFGGGGGPDQLKESNRDQNDQGGGQGQRKTFGAPSGPGSPNQFKRGNREQDNQGGGGQGKPKSFGEGSPGGPNQFKQGDREQDHQGGGGQGKSKGFGEGSPGGPNQFKQGNRDQFDQGGGSQGKPKTFGAPGGPGGPNQFKQGNRDQFDQGGGQGKPKTFGAPGGPGGPNQFKQGGQGGGQVGQGGGQGGQRAQGNQGGGGGGDSKRDKCQKHPEKPECQNPN
jgi:hypothetical protein